MAISDDVPVLSPGSAVTAVDNASLLTATVTPTPTTTEAVNPGWAWLMLLPFIPLAGAVIYYNTIVKKK